MSSVERHYGTGDLEARVLAALTDAGADVDNLTIDDLAPIDSFHIRGREATAELAARAGVGAGERVLDAGCGIGGTSRYLAATFGCHVTGVDLTAEFVEVARELSARVGLSGSVDFRQGSVLDLPFDDGAFDLVWTEHVQMNIADKDAFYGELFRVLRPGGKLAFQDVFAGPEDDVFFPVPWADEPAISHLISVEDLRTVLGRSGFSQLSWEDKTAVSAAYFRARKERGATGQGPSIFMRDAETKVGNLLRNLEEGRVCVVMAAMRKNKEA